MKNALCNNPSREFALGMARSAYARFNTPHTVPKEMKKLLVAMEQVRDSMLNVDLHGKDTITWRLVATIPLLLQRTYQMKSSSEIAREIAMHMTKKCQSYRVQVHFCEEFGSGPQLRTFFFKIVK